MSIDDQEMMWFVFDGHGHAIRTPLSNCKLYRQSCLPCIVIFATTQGEPKGTCNEKATKAH